MFDPYWLHLPVVLLVFSAWLVYEHRRTTLAQQIAIRALGERPLPLQSLGAVVEAQAALRQQIDAALNRFDDLHEWQINSTETTNGRSFVVYRCDRCGPAHVERRERN